MGQDGFIPRHGGFENLVTYQKAAIIFQATYYLTAKWIRPGSRTRDQMEQAARSGKQNIVEGSLISATSKEGELKLTNVAKASLGELLEDYQDFLTLRGKPVWDKASPEALEIRGLAKPGVKPVYDDYRHLIESDDPEIVGNTMVCLLRQTCYLLGQQIAGLEKDFLQDGGIRERMARARVSARAPDVPRCPLCEQPMRLRTAKTGSRAGQDFWGCSAYPACRGTRATDT